MQCANIWFKAQTWPNSWTCGWSLFFLIKMEVNICPRISDIGWDMLRSWRLGKGPPWGFYLRELTSLFLFFHTGKLFTRNPCAHQLTKRSSQTLSKRLMHSLWSYYYYFPLTNLFDKNGNGSSMWLLFGSTYWFQVFNYSSGLCCRTKFTF